MVFTRKKVTRYPSASDFPDTATGEDTPVTFPAYNQYGVSGYKSKLNWQIAACGRGYSTLLDNNSRLKLSSTQSVWCCPATGHLFHWVRKSTEKWSVTCASTNNVNKRKPTLRCGCLNVPTMTTGLSTDLQTIRHL